VLSAGDSSRLNRDLVQRRQIAFNASAAANSLGERYGSLFLLQGAPRHPHTVAELEKEFYGHLEKLKTEPVGEAELRRALNQAEAGLYNGLDRNAYLAMRILSNAQVHHDVDAEFKRVEALKSVTAAEVMTAAKKYFIETNRTVGILQRKAEGGEK
jgi:predicted Zn-dependent peptidase